LHETLAILEQGLAECAPNVELHRYYIERLEKCNRTEEAIEAARRAARLFPDVFEFRLREALLLPVLYDSTKSVALYRGRYEAGLAWLLTAQSEPKSQLAALQFHVNKYLAYQGQNDRALQIPYGQFVHRAMMANFPEWMGKAEVPAVGSDGRLRIGYVSARFRDVSVPRAFLGWMEEQDRAAFHTIGYQLGSRSDAMTARVQAACSEFRQMGADFEETAGAIHADKLHVLVYLDVGMDPLMTQLAALRLAPVQCIAWDHPVTSGLPHADYFLSSELCEPTDAMEHYSEKLVPLPGLGMCTAEPASGGDAPKKTRDDFGLREDAPVFLTCQSIFKYLPAQDALFAAIAARVPEAQFVFLVTNEIVRDCFRERLGRAFGKFGLSVAGRCHLLPEMSRSDYWSLLRCGDVALDTIGWSGGISTLDAVTAEIPVVTMRTGQMRGRQSAAIFTMMGATETVAECEEEYVEIAVRLVTDRDWRSGVLRRMADGRPKLWSDRRCVRALEEFFRRAVADASQ